MGVFSIQRDTQKNPELTATVLDQLEHAGVPGISEARSARLGKRLFYTLIVVSFLFLAIIHTIVTVRNAVNSSSSTNVGYGATVELDTPDITICNRFSAFINETKLAENYFTKFREENNSDSQINENGENGSMDRKYDLEEWIALTTMLPGYDTTAMARSRMRAERLLNKKPLDLSAALCRMGHGNDRSTMSLADHYRILVENYMISCRKTFSTCSIKSVKVKCCSSGYMSPVMTVAGPCWKTNVNKVRHLITGTDGRTSRLLIYMKRWSDPVPEAEPKYVKKYSNFLLLSFGTNQWFGQNAATMVFDHNTQTFFGVGAKKIFSMPSRGQCVPTNSIRSKLNFLREYSSFYCNADREMQKANHESACKLPGLELFNPTVFENDLLNREYCDLLPLNGTPISDYRIANSLTYLNATVKMDIKRCPPLCQRHEYFFAYIREIRTETLSNSNKTSLWLDFVDQSYTIFEEVEALVWYDYVSLVGGIWGIWIGSSLITFLQIFEIPFWLCFTKPNRANIDGI